MLNGVHSNGHSSTVGRFHTVGCACYSAKRNRAKKNVRHNWWLVLWYSYLISPRTIPTTRLCLNASFSLSCTTQVFIWKDEKCPGVGFLHEQRFTVRMWSARLCERHLSVSLKGTFRAMKHVCTLAYNRGRSFSFISKPFSSSSEEKEFIDVSPPYYMQSRLSTNLILSSRRAQAMKRISSRMSRYVWVRVFISAGNCSRLSDSIIHHTLCGKSLNLISFLKEPYSGFSRRFACAIRKWLNNPKCLLFLGVDYCTQVP